jgi:colanic acid/amylovoran biosynthesis protein
MGDIAMLKSAVEYLRELWPDAYIKVITSKSKKLISIIPGVIPVPVFGKELFFSPIIGRMGNITSRIENVLRLHNPMLYQNLLMFKRKLLNRENEDLKFFCETLFTADTVIASGGCYLNDKNKEHAKRVLGLLNISRLLGKPVAMFGQSIGPIKDKILSDFARNILPKIDLITLRTKYNYNFLQKRFNLNKDKAIVTGDNAIKIALKAKARRNGNSIGFNLRLSDRSCISPDVIKILSETVSRSAEDFNTSIIPVPISFYEKFNDLENTVRAAKLNFNFKEHELHSPEQIIELVDKCKILVTSSYHAGVFALSRGIPVVAISQTDYYDEKFLGLSEMFPVGCVVLRGDDLNSSKKIYFAIKKSWNSTVSLKEKIIGYAISQNKANMDSYQLFHDIVNKKILEKKRII